MLVERLPRALLDTADLAALNARLRAGQARLDWSAVVTVAPAALIHLFDGLDMVRDEEVLGLETVPDALQEKVAAALPRAAAPPTRPRSRGQRRAATERAPRTWSAPDAQDAGDLPDMEPGGGAGSGAGGDGAGTDGAGRGAGGDGLGAVGAGHEGASVAAGGAEGETRPLLVPPSARALRAELEERVLRDLLGPAGGPEEEVADDVVHERYLVGTLAPRGRMVLPEESDELAVTEAESPESGPTESAVTPGRSMLPSSLGLTFGVAAEATEIVVTCRWGAYRRERSATLADAATGTPRLVWKRRQVEAVSPPIPLRVGLIEDWVIDAEYPEVVLRGRVRQTRGDWIVSLFLVNNQHEPKQLRDRAWLFQPEIAVAAPDGAPIFRRRPAGPRIGHDDPAVLAETEALAMLYRRRLEFAVGHGAAAHAVVDPAAPDRAVRVETRVVPSYEVPLTTPPTPRQLPGLANLALDMRRLAELSGSEAAHALAALPQEYAAWIEAARRRAADPHGDLAAYRPAAGEALDRCAHALERLRAGLALLARDEQAARAFRFMNEAMAMQRVRTLYAEERRRGGTATPEDLDRPENRSWRPFQLAFILINLPALTDLSHPERALDGAATADLLWFPTGGGKTEAYLGLTAYTLAIRRLQGTVAGHDGENGVAVLMRYTLRLLTVQQFQRAAALLCACETIRRAAARADDLSWGHTPFRVGLWVGQRTTPNTTEQSEQTVRDARGGGRGERGATTPAQLTSCPWCGAPIDAGRDITVETVTGGRGRTLIYCGDELGACSFSRARSPREGLPIVVVDEEIYRLLPALLIATVDKFAQLPWKGETAALFGRVTGRCTRHGFRCAEIEDKDSHPARGDLPRAETLPHPPLRPPDLIIQDELHLISGPLGTLVGLYETAVDRLAAWEVNGRTVRPKVIASTATIRQAARQVHHLFARTVEVFPPQGVDAEDSFFALQQPVSDAYPGRLYLGICAPGRRLKAVLIRVYVAYLAASQSLYDRYGVAADPWMTLVGYFNSMRELGGMRRLVEDDVRSRLLHMDERGLAKRYLNALDELTSRKRSSEIPATLERLERRFDPADAARRKAGGGKGAGPYDVLLATNMLSVGVDVRRLGLMVVAGQPKSTAEYIQATSRVGRGFPGLVCTVFNWARPRDLSHYERFEQYHATFYQHVEALSVTPFAPRAIDRGLSALLAALVRLGDERLNANAGAGLLRRDDPLLRAAVEAIMARVGAVEAGAARLVAEELERRVDEWMERVAAQGTHRLGYKTRHDGVTLGLLRDPDNSGWQPFTVLNSLRDVEPPVGLILHDGGAGEEPAWLSQTAPALDEMGER